MVRYDRDLQRVWVAGWRCHHGMVGAILAVVGTLLMAHDRRDLRKWLHDTDHEPPR